MELGLEERSDWYTLRGWYGLNTGLSFIKTAGKVVSNQIGLAGFAGVGPAFPIMGVPFKMALMAFYFFESFDLTAATTGEALSEGETRISGVSFTVGYAGLGVALSW